MAMSQQSLPPVNNYTGSFTEDHDGDGVRLNAFEHEDADIGFDPLSANRRFAGTADLAVLGTSVFAGPTREPFRHIGTPATCILGRAQPNPQTVEKRKQQQLP